MSGTTTTDSGRRAGRTRRLPGAVVRIVGAIASVGLLGSLVGLVVTPLRLLGSGQFMVDLPVGGNAGFNYHGSASVVGMGTTVATFTIDHVSTTLGMLFVTQAVVESLLQGVIAFAVLAMCWQLWRERPFVRTFTRTLYITAGAVAIGGTALELLPIAIRYQALHEITGGDPDTPLGSSVSFAFTGIWLLVGLGIAALAAVFQAGERLQRDTEGLV